MSNAFTGRLKQIANAIYSGGFADSQHKLVLPKNTTVKLAEILPVEQASLAYDTTLNEVVVNNGSGFSPISAGSGANTSLNNLTSTSVNADIVPGVDNSIKLGSTTLGYLDIYANLLSSTNLSNLSIKSPDVSASLSAPAINVTGGNYNGSNILRRGGQINISGGSGTQRGGTVHVSGGAGTLGGTLFISGGDGSIGAGSVQMTGGATTSGDSGGIELFTSIPTDNVSDSGEIRLQTGQVANGTNGNIILAIGPVSGGGTRGKIQFTDGSEGTSSYVWTSTDTLGSGTWMPAASSGANTALSNLTTTSINENLIPATIIKTLGQPNGGQWGTVYASIYNAGADGADLVVRSLSVLSGNTGNAKLSSGNSPDANSGDVNIISGNANVNSGNIKLNVGTAGSTRGKIQFQDGSEGTSGYVWTSIDTNGNGAWTLPSGGGSAAGPSGSVQFSDGSGGFLADDAAFHWDDTAFSLSVIGGDDNTTPALQLTASTFRGAMQINNAHNTNFACFGINEFGNMMSTPSDTGDFVIRTGGGPSGSGKIVLGPQADSALTLDGTLFTATLGNLYRLTATASQVRALTIVTGDYTISASTDFKVLCNSGAGTFNLTLPPGEQGLNFIIGIAAANAGTFTIVPDGSDVLDTNIQGFFLTQRPLTITFNAADTTWYPI